MRGFKNTQGTFFHCSEIGERNWVLRLVGSGDIGTTARNFSKNPSQRLDTGIIPTPWWFTSECEQQLLSIGEDGKIPSSIKPGSASTPDSTIAELTEEQLRHRLKLQLEYYFSRENLNQDRYLRSQMDNDQYVPIQVVASFPKISHLTSDQDLIISVLKESINVQVDESNTKVRAAHRRCTLLLREIPEFTDEREVKAMFIGCPPYTSLKYGLNNSWYVTFETEEATQLAFLHLQNLRKSFNGKQICVRIKTGSAPLPDPSASASATNGRNSPAKSDIFIGIGNGISTIATSKGYITGFPAASTFTLNPNCTTRLTTETELNLDQLMGTFGYSIRAIFQPKDSEPPKNEPSEDVPLLPPDEKKAKRENSNPKSSNILGPPSTEIVESMLSAAAEANETKKREREVQKQQWQQIMDNLAPMPSIMGGQRITDSLPFIKRPPPVLHRFISQESADIEVALDIQRAARKQQEKETKQQQQQPQVHVQPKIQPQQQNVQPVQQQQIQPQIQQHQQQYQHVQHQTYSQHQQPQQLQQQPHPPPLQQQQQQHYSNNNDGGYRQNNNSNRKYSDRSNNKEYNHQYNGYSSGERSNYDKSDRRPNQPYRGGRSYDARSDRSGKSDSYSNKSDNYNKNESSYCNKNENYNNKSENNYKPRGERNNDHRNNYNSNNTTSTTSNNYYYDRSTTSNYSNQQQPRYEKPRYQSDRKPAATTSRYYQQQQHNFPLIQTTSYPSTVPTITAAATVSATTSAVKVRNVSNSEPPPIITPKTPTTPSSSTTVPSMATTITKVEQQQHHHPTIVPVVITPPTNSSHSPLTTTTTIVHSDTASTTSSTTRKKDNSESSEYNFVDGDFPSLVEKEKKVQAKEKEKAKFSAVVAGKKNDVKKSYAQTLKRQESKQSSKADAAT